MIVCELADFSHAAVINNPPKLVNKSKSFDAINEIIGKDQTSRRMYPANEGLHANDISR